MPSVKLVEKEIKNICHNDLFKLSMFIFILTNSSFRTKSSKRQRVILGKFLFLVIGWLREEYEQALKIAGVP